MLDKIKQVLFEIGVIGCNMPKIDGDTLSEDDINNIYVFADDMSRMLDYLTQYTKDYERGVKK